MSGPEDDRQEETRLERASAKGDRGGLAADKLRNVVADLDFTTDRLSTQVRSISLGVLAVIWALLVKEERNTVFISHKPLLAIAAVAILTLLLDFFQYLAAFRVSLKALERRTETYNRKWLSYRLRVFFFYAKIGTALGTAMALLYVLAAAIA